jgi:histone deacetylase 11
VTTEELPLIYSDKYNIRLFGIQKLHPFDTEKYDKIYQYLLKHPRINKRSFIKPGIISDKQLLKIHSKKYLKSLSKSINIAEIAESPFLSLFPHAILQKKLITPMKYGVGGTILGTEIARKKGWAINLSGGYHHAKEDSGEGFCFFSDIALAINHLWETDNNLKILVIDLDAHQGNGIVSIFATNNKVFLFDVYNTDIYPNDSMAKKNIDFDFPIHSFTRDHTYLKIIRLELPKVINQVKPDFIIYNAGTDILAGDSLGALNISENGIIQRDQFVFQNALILNIPILMLLSGGYSKQSGLVIGKSIMNILNKLIKIV